MSAGGMSYWAANVTSPCRLMLRRKFQKVAAVWPVGGRWTEDSYQLRRVCHKVGFEMVSNNYMFLSEFKKVGI